jgi:hypothetical protein
MNSLIRKTLQILSTGSISFVLACKYGVPMELHTKTIHTKTETDQPIAGLHVLLYEKNLKTDSTETNQEGFAVFNDVITDYYIPITAKIKDIDGENNFGKFKDTTISLTSSDYYEVTLKKGK